MNVLLADPTRTWLRASELRLRRHGWCVEVGADGPDIIAALHRVKHFDVALIDAGLFGRLPGGLGNLLVGTCDIGASWPVLPSTPDASTGSWLPCSRPVDSAALFRLVDFLTASAGHRLLALDVAGEAIATQHDTAAAMATLEVLADELNSLAASLPPDRWEHARHRAEGACATLGASALASHLAALRQTGAGDTRLACLKDQTLSVLRALVPIFFPHS
jgi:hypothetical protein